MKCFNVNVRKEPTEHGFMPILQLYLVEGVSAPRPIVIIAPGGGYCEVCTLSDGDRIALQYNAAGFHAAVLDYSVLPHHFPEPQTDMMLAIRLVRENAIEWGVHPDQIGICGFSAGGHICGMVSTLWNISGEEIYRPNAAILCFAPLTLRLEHCKSFLSGMMGTEDAEKVNLAACDEQVNVNTPPTFLYGTYEDKLANVENILYYSEKLSKNKIPFEVHIMPKGGHGESWCDDTIWAKTVKGRDYNYIRLSIEWMRELFGYL